MKRMIIGLCLIIGGCVTAQKVTPPALPVSGEMKRAVIQCEDHWQSVTVPACFPDNLTGLTGITRTELIFMGSYTTPCGPAYIWMDLRPGVCGHGLILGFAVRGQHWLSKGDVLTEATSDEFLVYLKGYEESHKGESS